MNNAPCKRSDRSRSVSALPQAESSPGIPAHSIAPRIPAWAIRLMWQRASRIIQKPFTNQYCSIIIRARVFLMRSRRRISVRSHSRANSSPFASTPYPLNNFSAGESNPTNSPYRNLTRHDGCATIAETFVLYLRRRPCQ